MNHATKIIGILASLALTGCVDVYIPEETQEAYQDYIPETAVTTGYRCILRIKPPDQVVEVSDSLSTWPYADSGRYQATLIRTEWISTNNSCSLVGTHGKSSETSVVGGLKGIKRIFGRWKQAPGNPAYCPPSLPAWDGA